jgi:integrase
MGVGNIEEFPDQSAAAGALVGLRKQINVGEPRVPTRLTVDDLVKHFRQQEMDPATTSKSFATRSGYQGSLRKWISPHWGRYFLDEVQPIDVESWMKQQKLEPPTAAKIRSILHLLFNHACRYGFFDGNPIRWVRVRKKRKEIPDILTFEEAMLLLNALKPRERLMVLVDLGTGLRRSELFALKWKDIDFENCQISVRRSIFNQVIGHCKTENSRKPVEIAPLVAKALLEWRAQSRYSKPDDWVFASDAVEGAKPYWSSPIMRFHIEPAARRAGIQKKIGWHTFRRTFASWHKLLGTDVKVLQELMRHSSILTTLDIYTQGMRVAKQAAQNALMTRLFDAHDENQIGLANHVSNSVKMIEQLLYHTATTLNLLIQSLAPTAGKPDMVLGLQPNP